MSEISSRFAYTPYPAAPPPTAPTVVPAAAPAARPPAPPIAAPMGILRPKVKIAGTMPHAAPTTVLAASPVAPPLTPSAAAPPTADAVVALKDPSFESSCADVASSRAFLEATALIPL